MSSYGYQSDHGNLIANNLQDRYKSGFPILKELIQNADDAKARRLVFGLHPGFKGDQIIPFASEYLHKPVDKLAVIDLSAQLVRNFLQNIEATRGTNAP